MDITGAGTAANLVQGNLIGTDVTATVPLGNADGVLINGAPNNTIGGSSAGAANVFGFNNAAGVQISAGATTGTVILGNFFGTNANSDKFGNAVGVLDDSGGNTIGGSSSGVPTSSASTAQPALRLMARTMLSSGISSAPTPVARMWATQSGCWTSWVAIRSEGAPQAQPTFSASTA